MRLIILIFALSVLYSSSNTTVDVMNEKTGISLPANDIAQIATDSVPLLDRSMVLPIEMSATYNSLILDRIQILQEAKSEIQLNSTLESRPTYPVRSMVTLSLKPNQANVESLFIKMNNAPEFIFTQPIRLSAKGNQGRK